jgi:hypothetical protein
MTMALFFLRACRAAGLLPACPLPASRLKYKHLFRVQDKNSKNCVSIIIS